MSQINKTRQIITTSKVIEKLLPEYGSFEWIPRYDPASELVYTILSQHTSDLNSERAFNNLLSTFESLQNIAEADVKQIENSIRMGGLAQTKAPRIKNILNQVLNEVGSFDLNFLKDMPLGEAKAWLKRLNGVGPKTAAIILCFSLGMPAMPVDTHIYRVAQRLGLIGRKVTADQAHDLHEAKVAPEEVFEFQLLLINHGRSVCKARTPLCQECTLATLCPSMNKFTKMKNRKSTKNTSYDA